MDFSVIRNVPKGREIVQCFLKLYRDLSVIFRTYVEMPGVVACSCNHELERQRDRRIPGDYWSQSSLIGKLQANERPCFRKWMASLKMTQDHSLASTYMHTHMDPNTNMYRHTGTLKKCQINVHTGYH